MSGDFVLVTLVGDDATEAAASLAERLAERAPPSVRLTKDDVTAFEDGGGRTVVIFGHGGAVGLGPTRGSALLTAEWLAQRFTGGRVFAFACATLPVEDRPQSLGQRAVDGCVQEFVGFDGTVASPNVAALTPTQREAVHDAALAMVEAFLTGEGDERTLEKIGRDAVDGIEDSLRNLFELGTLLDQLHLRVAVARK